MIEDLLEKQQRLMDKVPHELRPDALVKMSVGIKIMDALLRYLNSTGHKPWRPIPLSAFTQQKIMLELEKNVDLLKYVHKTNAGGDKDLTELKDYSRQLISMYGIIEESVEYLNSLAVNDTRAHKLEELTDILFFYLESMILGRFTWSEIEEEYARKWKVNMKRYEDAEKGNYDWDKREEKKEL